MSRHSKELVTTLDANSDAFLSTIFGPHDGFLKAGGSYVEVAARNLVFLAHSELRILRRSNDESGEPVQETTFA